MEAEVGETAAEVADHVVQFGATSRLARCFETLSKAERRRPSDDIPPSFIGRVEMHGDVMHAIAALLDARALAAFGSCNSSLASLAAASVPGMRLRLYPHQRTSLAFLMRSEAGPTQGGILADEPGTGKTITTLSLLCKSAGLRTPSPRPVARVRQDLAEEAWTALALPFRREFVYGLFKAVRSHCPSAYDRFAGSAEEAAQTLPGYRALLGDRPLDFDAIKRDDVLRSILSRAAFDEAARSVPRAAKAYWSSEVSRQRLEGHLHPPSRAPCAPPRPPPPAPFHLPPVPGSCRSRGRSAPRITPAGAMRHSSFWRRRRG